MSEYTYPTRIIGYARVSTDDQDMALQRKALTEYGCDQIIEEHGSGGKMDRPGWRKVIRARRPGDTVVVWKIDRLGRTLSGVLEAVEEMAAEGVEFVSMDGAADTRTAMGRAFFQIAAVFAELERALISERTKAGMAVRKAQSGVKFGKPHSIKDFPKRLEAFRPYFESGEAEEMTPARALDILNRADPKAPKITSHETFRRWRRQGFDGLE